MILRCRQHQFTFPRPALIMGVVNVTPDSFSDGGQFLEPDKAVAQALRLIQEGADLIDIGGESTRPKAPPVGPEEEMRRVLPVIEQLAARAQTPISIDTTKPIVARAALQAGASLVNDVAAGREDSTMWRVVAETGAGYVVMHMKGSPPTMQDNPVYEDVVAEVAAFLSEKLDRLSAFGVGLEQIILDIGIGFGKTLDHNMLLLGALDAFTKWSRPLLLGASRKSFIGQITETTEVADRLPGSLACACWGLAHGVNIVRVHDVRATRQALRMTEAILARKK